MKDNPGERLSPVSECLEQRDLSGAFAQIRELTPAQIADLLEALQPEQRAPLWLRLDPAKRGEVLLELHGDVRRALVRDADRSELIASLAAMQMDELADLDKDLPMSIVSAMAQAMDAQSRQRYEAVRDYPDDSAGGLMDVDATAVRADVTLKAVLRYLRNIRRRDGALPEHLDSLMVVDRDNKLLGMLSLSKLVSLSGKKRVAEVCERGIPTITPETQAGEVARLFEDQDLLSAPVVDEGGHLLGRITVDDVIDVLRDEAEEEKFARVGLSQNADMFAPVAKSSTRRALWLGINLATAFAAAWVIGLFEASIEKVVALAILMPVVASMAGVAGSQTLTVVTRGIALDQVNSGNILRLLWHELGIGLLNGMFWALVVAVIAIYWFGDVPLGLIFGLSLLIGILTGALAGTLIPLVLKHLGVDPALAGGVVLTTATDAIGFLTFLGLATLVIL